MDSEMIVELAKKVQQIAEGTHCASAILAVQEILLAKTKAEYNTRTNKLREEMDKAVENEDINKAKDIKAQIDAVQRELEKSKVQIRVIYDNISERSANLVKRNGTFAIVLPVSLKKVIADGVDSGFDKWTDNMKHAKEKLRERTAHELAHITIDSLYDPYKSTELDAQNFMRELLKIRIERNGALRSH